MKDIQNLRKQISNIKKLSILPIGSPANKQNRMFILGAGCSSTLMPKLKPEYYI